MEVQRYFADANGNHYVAPFATQELADAYAPPAGAVEVDAPAPEAPSPPTMDDQYPPLEEWRFWATVNMPGSFGEDALYAAIKGHPDPVFKAVALARLRNPPGGFFVRSDPMFANQALMTDLGADEDVINAMWDAGHAIHDPTAAG